MNRFKIWFRYNNKNSYSIAALMPLVEAGIAREPKDGIMLYSFATAQAEEVYSEVSRAAVDAVYIAGGPHPSALPEEVLEHFDFVVIGEGEETLPELLEAIEEGRDPATVKGIAYKCQGQVLFTEKRPPVDLDSYPPFAKILAPIEISRGCPWGCTYCQTPRLFGSCMRHRSIPSSPSTPAATRISASPPPTRWPTAPMGAGHGWRRSRHCSRLWPSKKSPSTSEHFPPRSGRSSSPQRPWSLSSNTAPIRASAWAVSPAALQCCAASAGATGAREIETACELALDYGLMPQVDLIFGLPMESEKDQRMTLDLVRWIAAKGGKVRAHRFMPLPGTPLAGTRPAPLADDVEACLGKMALEGRLTGTWSAGSRTD